MESTILKFITILKNEGFKNTVRKSARYILNICRNTKYRSMLKKSNLADKFTNIYDENLWSSPESVSGTGSELKSTIRLRRWLIKTIPSLAIEKIVDAPCGDFNWMQYVVNEVDIKYIGIDIVPELIFQNQKKFADENISFITGNVCEDLIPDCDLLITRDCLFHLSFGDIDKFLKNLSNVNYRYLLTTSHLVENKLANRDIISGDYRHINLFLPPFNFNPNSVVDRVCDCLLEATLKKEMVLVEKRDVPTSLYIS